jgi:hypothetical protein
MKIYLQTGAHYDRLTNGYMRYLNKDKEYYYEDKEIHLRLSISNIALVI